MNKIIWTALIVILINLSLVLAYAPQKLIYDGTYKGSVNKDLANGWSGGPNITDISSGNLSIYFFNDSYFINSSISLPNNGGTILDNYSLIFNLNQSVAGRFTGVNITDGTYASFGDNAGVWTCYDTGYQNLLDDTGATLAFTAGKFYHVEIGFNATKNNKVGFLRISGIKLTYPCALRIGAVPGKLNIYGLNFPAFINGFYIVNNSAADTSIPKFIIYTKDSFNNSLIDTTITLTNSSGYLNKTNTSGGSFTFTSAIGIYNITVERLYYHTQKFVDYNTNVDLSVFLSRFFNIDTVNYSNYATYNNTNYVKNLYYSVNTTCLSETNTSLSTYINLKQYSQVNLTCNNLSQEITGAYIHNNESIFNISFYLNNTFNDSLNILSAVTNFTSDLFNPNITRINLSIAQLFSNATMNISFSCNDTKSPLIFYNLSLNGNALKVGNDSNNVIIYNITYNQNGLNTILVKCSDFLNTTSRTLTQNVYTMLLILVDEKNNTDFNLNCTSARVYVDDNSSIYDFKQAGKNYVNFTSLSSNKLRFEIGYSNGDIITRYVDVSLADNPLRVCANVEGTTHYEQLLISAAPKIAILKNIYSNCLVAQDYTRFAYQTSYFIKAYTIASSYSLSTYSNGKQILLANYDGSLSSYINLDSLEFSKTAYNINTQGDTLTFEQKPGNQVLIYYKNIKQDNTALNLKITNLVNNNLVLDFSDFNNSNEFTFYFDYTGLANISNTTIFRAELTKTTSAGTSLLKQYFNVAAKSGILTSGFAFAMALFLLVFGLTFTIARTTFAWFGILLLIACLAILSFATSTWYILFLEVMIVIILIYNAIVMLSANYGELT